jgi:hypothetical protein
MQKKRPDSKNKRIWGDLSPEEYKKLGKLAERLGMPSSKLVGLATIAGVGVLSRSLYPEEFMNEDILKKILDLQKVEQPK